MLPNGETALYRAAVAARYSGNKDLQKGSRSHRLLTAARPARSGPLNGGYRPRLTT